MVILFVGDYLSFAVGKSAQESQQDNTTSANRLEGLVMVMADFHVLMNLCDLIFKDLFHVCTHLDICIHT